MLNDTEGVEVRYCTLWYAIIGYGRQRIMKYVLKSRLWYGMLAYHSVFSTYLILANIVAKWSLKYHDLGQV